MNSLHQGLNLSMHFCAKKCVFLQMSPKHELLLELFCFYP